ncbi:MAG TPA: hypothetical protein VGW38_05830, partial [Chloroflexota bacterium]|nr:hypothetical protein [Chloroflexota bacterium]
MFTRCGQWRQVAALPALLMLLSSRLPAQEIASPAQLVPLWAEASVLRDARLDPSTPSSYHESPLLLEESPRISLVR